MVALTGGRSHKKADPTVESAQTRLAAGHPHEAFAIAAVLAEKAFADLAYEALPPALRVMQQARASIRAKALAAGNVSIVSGELPAAADLKPGCYLVQPPRVGVDGRAIRQLADEQHVPVLVIVREPTTRDGAWPVVTIGPATIRTRVEPPTEAKPKGKQKPGSEGIPVDPVPAPQWFEQAAIALAETGIEQAKPEGSAAARVEALLLRVQAHPDGDALYSSLIEACEQAAREPKVIARPRKPLFDEEDDEAGDLG